MVDIGLPSNVCAYGWIPFVAAILLCILFSGIYVKHFWCHSERDWCSAVTSIVGLSIALLGACLLPVDVFLVSFLKNSDGSFKDWVTNSTVHAVEDSVTYTFYSLYGVMFVYTFLVLPLSYFSYEERDDEHPHLISSTAVIYTFVFILLVGSVLLAGAFIPFRGAPPSNSTEWEKFEFIVDQLSRSRGKDAFQFLVNILTVYGMLNLILYTSVGMASLPLALIKGFRSLSDEEEMLSENQVTTQSRINAIRSKQMEKALSHSEIAALAALEEEESLISRRSSVLVAERRSLWYKCRPVIRIFSIVCGVIGLTFSFTLWSSLLIANIDRLMHSMGYKMGYAITGNELLIPLDYIMVEAQKVFPLDYVLFFCIIIFLLMCTVSGMRYIGIRCLCVPMYRVRPRRTPPQGLILLTFILIFSVLAFHILMYSVSPRYTTFGSQCYKVNSTCEPCTLDAPQGDCLMTRGASLILSFAYKAWIFGVTYFWLTWVFLATFILSVLVNLIRPRQSSLEEAVDRDDFDDSYEQMIRG